MKKKGRKGRHTPPNSGTLLGLVRGAGRTGLTAQQLMLKLGLDKRARPALQRMLDQLMAQGKVEAVRRGRYRALGGERRSGTGGGGTEALLELISSGAGYARLGNGDDDVYIPEHALGTALHGDRVLIQYHRERGRSEGKVLNVVKRRRTQFVGRVEQRGPASFLVADDAKMHQRIALPSKDLRGAKPGEKVIVEMLAWENPKKAPIGRVLQVLGKAGEHDVEMHAILAEYDLPAEFSEAVVKAAEAIPDGMTPSELKKRRDLRRVTTFSIDPADAKDLDDALSIRKLENGHWEVGVHIADVSHYVRPNDPVGKEASLRATSVYLVDRVVPMLPERLSNDLCSLNPDEDKLAFSAVFELDDQARIRGEWFGRTVVRSNHRFAYEQAQALIDGATGKYGDEVRTLDKLAKVLRKQRLRNGALDVGGNEVKFRLDDQGRPIEVYEKVMGPANWLIEEFMLLANKQVATWVSRRQGGAPPFVYRIHDVPDPEKIAQLRSIAKSFGHELRTDVPPEELNKAFNKLMKEIKGTDEERLLKELTIRSMNKAIYSTDNIGHFGLAFRYYTHFTSPIRRYPDLMVHRALAHYLAAGKPLNKEALEVSCVHSSQMEKRAAEAERASIKYKQAEYLLARLGQTFAGLVSGVTNWGLYVELIDNKCEGMIALEDLPGDRYHFDQHKYAVVGLHSGRRFSLGDHVRVTVRAVDMEKRNVDLTLVDGDAAPPPPPKPRSTRTGRRTKQLKKPKQKGRR